MITCAADNVKGVAMPVVIRPGSDDARYTSLVEISRSHKKDSEAGKGLLSEGLVTEIDAVIVPYQQTMGEVTNYKHRRTSEIAEKNDALITLNYYVRHFQSGIKNRVIREKLPTTLLTQYGLPLSGTLPQVSISKKLIIEAEKLVLNDEQAAEKGFKPMSNPSAEELESAIAAAKAEIADTDNLDKELNEVEERLAEHRNSADTLISDVIDELQFHLRKLPDSDRRRVMRNYGFSFKSDSLSEEITAE